MCRQCHSAFTNDEVVTQLKETAVAPNYIKWNTTSVSHVAIAASGENGEEARVIGLQLLRGYIEWRKQKPDDYMPESGLESMYVVSDLEEIYKRCVKQTPIDDFKPAHPLKHREFGRVDTSLTKSALVGGFIGLAVALTYMVLV